MRGLFAAVTAFMLAVGVATGQGQSRTVIAVVENVNVLRKTVTVLDTWGKATEFNLRGGAEIRNSKDSVEEFRTIYDLKPGYRVQLTYEGTADNPYTIRITILPRQEK